MTDPAQLRRRNLLVMATLLGLVVGMVGLLFAAVPLYDLFCRVTGIGGTTQTAEAYAEEVLDCTVTVSFDAGVNRDLPWRFEPEVRQMTVRIGEPGLVHYRATNLADVPVTGQVVYNVTPFKTGLYFAKVQCFCFDEQTLEPGQSVDMPAYFYVDPALAEDSNLDDVAAITLSYTFFPARSEAFEGAQEEYYRSIERATGSPSADAGAAPGDAIRAAQAALR